MVTRDEMDRSTGYVRTAGQSPRQTRCFCCGLDVTSLWSCRGNSMEVVTPYSVQHIPKVVRSAKVGYEAGGIIIL